MRLLSIGLLFLLLLSATASVRADERVNCRANRGRLVTSRSVFRYGRQRGAVAPVCVSPGASGPVIVSAPVSAPPVTPVIATISTPPTPTAQPAPLVSTADSELASDLKEDLERLQGAWQRTETLSNGGQLRSEKTIQGHHETLKTFGPDGTLLREQQAELKFERAGDLRMVRWSQAVVTAGRDTGAKINDGTAVYTFKNGKWVSVIGLAQDEKWGVYTEAWTRDFKTEAEKGK